MIRTIYRKELMDAFRDKKTLLLTVLVPMILNIGIVVFFEHFMFSDQKNETYKVAVSSSASKEVVNQLLYEKQLEVKIDKDPVKLVKNGDAVAAVVVDKTFDHQVQKGQGVPNITIYSDMSSQKAGNATGMISDRLDKYSQAIVKQRLAEKQISYDSITPFKVDYKMPVEKEDQNNAASYMVSIFFPIAIIMAVLSGGLPAASEFFAGEKERKTMESLLITPVRRSHLVLAKWLAIATISGLTALVSLVSFFAAVKGLTKTFSQALQTSSLFSLFSSALIASVLFSLLIAAILTIVSMMSNSFKEMQSYSSPLFIAVLLPFYALIGTSPNELTTMHFLIPLVNIFALLKEISFGTFSITHLFYVSFSLLVFIAISFFIMLNIFKKDRWLIAKS